MSLYGTGESGVLRAGDVIISLKNTVGDTGQRLVAPAGQEVDIATYPDLAAALGGGVPPDNSNVTMQPWDEAYTSPISGISSAYTVTLRPNVVDNNLALLAEVTVTSMTLVGDMFVGVSSSVLAPNSGVRIGIKWDSAGNVSLDASGGGRVTHFTPSTVSVGDTFAVMHDPAENNLLQLFHNGVLLQTQNIGYYSTGVWFQVASLHSGNTFSIETTTDTADLKYSYPIADITPSNPVLPDLSTAVEDFKMVVENPENAGTTPDII